MYKFSFLLLFLAGIFTSHSAQSQGGIEGRLQEYFEATKTQDWEKVVDMLYPPLFELVEKEAMVQMFTDMEGNGMKFSMSDFKARNISEAYAHEGEKFAEVDYTARMNIQFTSEAYKGAEMAKLLQDNFSAIYGAENVTYQAENNSFDILAEKKMLAIAGADNEEWTFIEKNENMDASLKQIIPEEVIAHFGQ